MAKQRIDWKGVGKRVGPWMKASGRRVANLAKRGFRAARHEASKDKYREYLSEAYGQMRERYPAVENTAKEALDAIGVRPRAQAGTRTQANQGTAARKTTRKKTTAKKKTTARKKTSRKTTASKKKAGTRKKAA